MYFCCNTKVFKTLNLFNIFVLTVIVYQTYNYQKEFSGISDGYQFQATVHQASPVELDYAFINTGVLHIYVNLNSKNIFPI